MQSVHDRVTTMIDSLQPSSRRGLITSGAKLAAVGGLAFAMTGGARRVSAQDATPAVESPFASPVDVLQYALTLEHLETAFYRDALAQFDEEAFVAAGYQVSVREYVVAIGEHEAAHVETLAAVITDLGEEPVTEATYDFGYTDLATFLQTAAAIENLGVNAYTGAAASLIEEDALLTAALTIHGVEARHAAYLNVLTGAVPFPNAVDLPQTPDEVLAIAGPFITGTGGGDDEATPAS